MRSPELIRVGLAAVLALMAGCVVQSGGNYLRGGYYGNSSWDIVRRDRCRYEEYRQFAEDHENPDEREQFIKKLAREGCSLEREPRTYYSSHRDRDRAWDIVSNDPCRYDEYRRYAEQHKNPEKRWRFIERLARDGCSRD